MGPTALKFFHSLARKNLTKNQGSGIITIPNRMRSESEASAMVQTIVDSGLPLEKFDQFIKSEDDILKYLNIIKNANKPKVIPADSLEGRGIMEALLGKRGEVVDMAGKKLDTSQGIMGGKSVKELMDSGQVTKGPRGMKKSKKIKDREMFQDANKRLKTDVNKIIADIKAMDPMDSMKEANSVIGRKGKYKNLTPEESKKILQDTEDHIFQRDIPEEDFADGGVAGLLGERPGYAIGKRVENIDFNNITEDDENNEYADIEGQTAGLLNNPLTRALGISIITGGTMTVPAIAKEMAKQKLMKEIIIKPGSKILSQKLKTSGGGSNFDPSGPTQASIRAERPDKSGAGQIGGFTNPGKKSYGPHMADGGPARQNFAMGKRAFLKLIGSVGAGIAGLKSGLIGMGGKSATKKAVTETVKSAGSGTPPPYFFKLVDKIKTMGDDVTTKTATQERQQVTRYKDYELTEDVGTGEKTIQRIKISDDGPQYYDETLAEETYMSYKPGKSQADEVTPKVADEYVEDTSYIRTSGPQKGDIYDTVDGVPDDVLEEIGEKKIISEKADGGRIGMMFGSSVLKAILRKSAEKKGISVTEFLRTMNPKAIPPEIKKYMTASDIEALKKGQGDFYQNLADMMKTRKSFQDQVEAGKKTPASMLFDHMEKIMDQQSYVPRTVTDKDIGQVEQAIKNKFFKGRKDNAEGGIARMLGE
jgi:hypothetical protein